MILDRLSIRHLRAIHTADLDLASGINLFSGPNGAGKTSVLEAVHVLASGRSFRAAQLEAIKQHSQLDLTLAARVRHGDEMHQLGLSKQADSLILRRDGVPVERLVDLARDLAVITLHADSDQLILGSPQVRRRYLDWWLFHVQPAFFSHWARYQRLLKQRNAALRTDPRQLDAWDVALAEAGEQVAQYRQQAADRLMDEVNGSVEGCEDFSGFGWSLHPGWTRQESLLEVLHRTRGRDREQGFTAQGPHRAELRLQVRGKEAREVLSRGQQKTLATLMLLAQARTFRAARNGMPIILLDDLASELDARHREGLLAEIIGLGGQVLLTALDVDELASWLPDDTRRFSVQAGQVTML